ncbi:unnamed protein product [Laminaria digitata]
MDGGIRKARPRSRFWFTSRGLSKAVRCSGQGDIFASNRWILIVRCQRGRERRSMTRRWFTFDEHPGPWGIFRPLPPSLIKPSCQNETVMGRSTTHATTARDNAHVFGHSNCGGATTTATAINSAVAWSW